MMLMEKAYKIQQALGRMLPRRAINVFRGNGENPKGRALVSYMPLPVIGAADNFRGHSNVWESSEIVRLFNTLGFAADVIDWRDGSFKPRYGYDAVFDIHRNLLRYSDTSTRKVFHVTGSHPAFSNDAELDRLRAIQERRGVKLRPRRFVAEEDLRVFEENLENADMITLVGNEVTASTFPAHIRSKMRQVIGTGSILPGPVRTRQKRRPEFLWFNGAGAVHKGLDLVLEVFSRNPDLTLHVVGPYGKENDFVEAYRHELTSCPNIHGHGFLYPSDARFHTIASRVMAFVSPSCSEGMSTSAITCMQYGMIPIVSRRSGITLPTGAGIILEKCSPEEIEEAVCTLASEDQEKIGKRMESVRDYALANFSRTEFSSLMEAALRLAIDG